MTRDIVEESIKAIAKIKTISLAVMKNDQKFKDAVDDFAIPASKLDGEEYKQEVIRFFKSLVNQNISALMREDHFELKKEAKEEIIKRLDYNIDYSMKKNNEKRNVLITLLTNEDLSPQKKTNQVIKK